jgi:hypothetical protein
VLPVFSLRDKADPRILLIHQRVFSTLRQKGGVLHKIVVERFYVAPRGICQG